MRHLTLPRFLLAALLLGLGTHAAPAQPFSSASDNVITLLSEDFEEGIPSDWAVFGNEHSGGESVWAAYNESTLGNVARSRYTFSVPSGEFAEDYLATPQLDIGPGGATLSFLAADQFTTTYSGFYQVLVSTTSQTDPAAYEVVATYTDPDFPTASTGGATFEVDLSNYAGQSIYVAFLHRANNDDTWYLDDVVVTSLADPPVAVLSETEAEIHVIEGETASGSVMLSNIAEEDALELGFSAMISAARARSTRLVEPGTTAPASSPGAMSLARADGSTDARAYTAVEGPPFAYLRGGGAVMLTHSASQEILPLHGVACGADEYTTENSFWRVFDLADFPEAIGGLEVTGVEVGAESMSGPGLGTTVRLHTLEGAFRRSNLTLVGETTSTIPSGTERETIILPVSADFAEDDVLVVEWRVEHGDDEESPAALYPGTNDAGETGPSYLSSASCNIPEPTPYADMGFPDVHLVMNIHGLSESGTPLLLSMDPRRGSVAPGKSQEITLTANAKDFEPGPYGFLVTFATNDPENSILELEVRVNVGGVATEDDALPLAFALSPNYPNPFAGRTTIEYALPEATSVRLSVFDATGRLVATLVDGEREAGFHSVEWLAEGLASGVYFARIEAGPYRGMQRMLLVQ